MLRMMLFSGFFVLNCAAYASGSGGYGSNNTSSRLEPRPVDPTYELGKSIYLGRSGAEKIKYCIDNGKEKIKLKTKTIKPFKGANVKSLAAKLYDCNKPDVQIAQKLNQNDFNLVMYYLNKRYKLKLSHG